MAYAAYAMVWILFNVQVFKCEFNVQCSMFKCECYELRFSVETGELHELITSEYYNIKLWIYVKYVCYDQAITHVSYANISVVFRDLDTAQVQMSSQLQTVCYTIQKYMYAQWRAFYTPPLGQPIDSVGVNDLASESMWFSRLRLEWYIVRQWSFSYALMIPMTSVIDV